MKWLGLIVICLFVSIAGAGQTAKNLPGVQGPDLQQKQTPRPYKLNQNPSTKNAGNKGLNILAGIPGANWKGRVVGANSNGELISILPPDQMPCLVPDMSKVEKMPSGKFLSSPNGDQMPNVFPKIEIIPKQGK